MSDPTPPATPREDLMQLARQHASVLWKQWFAMSEDAVPLNPLPHEFVAYLVEALGILGGHTVARTVLLMCSRAQRETQLTGLVGLVAHCIEEEARATLLEAEDDADAP